MLTMVSCQKGGEPVPFLGQSAQSSDEIFSSQREGVPSNNGDTLGNILGNGSGPDNPSDDGGTIIGGDDNEDDDDLDDGLGNGGSGTGVGAGVVGIGGGGV